MRAAGVAPNAFTYSALMAACERAGAWQQALALFDRRAQTPPLFEGPKERGHGPRRKGTRAQKKGDKGPEEPN